MDMKLTVSSTLKKGGVSVSMQGMIQLHFEHCFVVLMFLYISLDALAEELEEMLTQSMVYGCKVNHYWFGGQLTNLNFTSRSLYRPTRIST